METDAALREKKTELTALREEAVRIVATASSEGRTPTNEEDSLVLGLLSRLRASKRRFTAAPKGRSAGY